MNEELIKKYQETITLLQYRLPGYSFYGSFRGEDGGKYSFELTIIGKGGNFNKKVFKPMETEALALRYFINTAQNRVF